jgi:predicted TIM-barrel fold metal-dependent hydrolase
MNFIDAHAHIWTEDTDHYPLAAGWKKADMQPRHFPAETLLQQARAAGVSRVNLIQMSFYGFDNSYMLDMMALYPDAFAGTAVIDPADRPAERMTELGKKRVRAFRIYPGLERGIRPNAGAGKEWLAAPAYELMFAAGAKNNQAISCLIGPDALPDLDRMCRRFPETPVIIDHLCRIGVDGMIRAEDLAALCDMASHPRVLVKIGAFYALGKKQPPYTDLGPLVQRVVRAFGAKRCMWESDCPYQIVDHAYADSINLIRQRLDFLSAEDKEWLLRGTAETFFFRR